MDKTNSTKRKSESVTFRLDSEQLSELRKVGEKYNRSLNMQVSRIIDKYLKWWRYETALRFVPMSLDSLRLIYAELGNEKASKIGGEIGKNIAQEMILHIYGQITKDTVLKALDVLGARFQTFEHNVNGNRHVMSIFHDVNEPFSVYISSMVAQVLQSVGIKMAPIHKPNSVVVTFELA